MHSNRLHNKLYVSPARQLLLNVGSFLVLKFPTFVFQNLQSATVAGFFHENEAETASVLHSFNRFNMLLCHGA